jgi:OPA family glycerol-3-phosphate transporter-like MFS transporter
VVAGWAAHRFGWRGALYVPAILLTLSAVHMLFFLKSDPGAAGKGVGVPHERAQVTGSVWQNLKLTLSNPGLWLVAVALCALDACRYGFTDWGVTHLKEVQKSGVDTAAFKYAVLPFGGIAGALASGWATDRFFRGRRAPVICVLMMALGIFALVYDTVIHWGLGASIAILFLIGFCIFGPQVLLVGTLPVDIARGGTAAAAVGFVNFMGYMGAAAGDVFTGHIAEKFGWPFAVRFWAACAFVGAVVIVGLWNRGKRIEATA